MEDAIWELVQSGCIALDDDNLALEPDTFGRIASYYYLHHLTMRHFGSSLAEDLDIPALLKVCFRWVVWGNNLLIRRPPSYRTRCWRTLTNLTSCLSATTKTC